MFTLAVFVLAFSITFQYSKCENTQYQNGYQYPQNMARQVNPGTGQQVDANGNPIMQGGAGGMQGQPINGQQQPMMPTNGNMPTTGGNQMIPQNAGMPNQQFPQQNPAMNGANQQFPQQNPAMNGANQQFPQQNPAMNGANQQFPQQNPAMTGANQQFPGSNHQFPYNQGYPGTQQLLPNQGAFPGAHQHYGGHGFHYPEPPHDLHLYPEGVHAYGYIMHTIESMLNDPTARNNLYYLFNNLQMVMSNPRSTPIIQEFFNRWSHAIGTPLGQMPTNVVVQNVPSSGSFLDTLKKKGNALVNLAKDVTLAKTKALNSLFDDSIFSPAVQVGTNWVNAGMQAAQGTVSPFIGSTPSTTGQTTITTPAMGTPLMTVQ